MRYHDTYTSCICMHITNVFNLCLYYSESCESPYVLKIHAEESKNVIKVISSCNCLVKYSVSVSMNTFSTNM